MHFRYSFITLVCMLLCLSVSIAQKPIKKTSPIKTLPKEIINQFSMVDDPKPVKYIKPFFDTVMYTPYHFYIAAINDSTYSNDSIGFILKPKSGKRQRLSFENGIKNAFSNFLDRKIKRDSALYPIILNIKKFSLTEQREKPYDKTDFNYEYEFLYPGKDKMEKISVPSGHGVFYSTIGFKRRYDTLISQSLGKDFSDLDDAMNEMIEKSPILCKGAKINVTLNANANNASDTIFYNPENELRWEDFTGTSQDADNTFGVYLDLVLVPGEIKYANTYYTFPITIGACFVKSQSWIGRAIKDADFMVHVNYEFKLTQVYALRLKKRIEQKQFTCENFRTELRNIHTSLFKELHAEMDNYDSETHYGQTKKAELRWQEQITNELLEESKGGN